MPSLLFSPKFQMISALESYQGDEFIGRTARKWSKYVPMYDVILCLT